MLSGSDIDEDTGYNYVISIAALRAAIAGGLSQYSDDQIQFILQQRSYCLSVMWAGADIVDNSPNPYGFGWGTLDPGDPAKIASAITTAGQPIDEQTLLTILQAEMGYLKAGHFIGEKEELFSHPK
jgi:hypothetical protein